MTNDDDHKPFLIRGYRRSDREGVRKLCCDTGFLGEPIDPVYEDRELFADFLTTYYTDHEPESCFLLEVDGEIRGYLLGSRKPLQNQLYALYQNVWLFFRALTRYFRYKPRSRRFIRWVLMYGWHEVPAQPRRVPHFHINLLPEARKVSTTRALMSAYLSYLYRSGEKRVCGQIITFESRRGEKMFERYGFKVLNRAEITRPGLFPLTRASANSATSVFRKPASFVLFFFETSGPVDQSADQNESERSANDL